MPGLAKRPGPGGFDRRHVEEKGVIMPVKRLPLKFLSGRHLLGRAGEGMRFLRSRPYEPLEDNPRDIDKFSPLHDLTVNEWEHETQADILVLADVSASMAYPMKRDLRDAAVLQLIYSLWRAGDRVRVSLFADEVIAEIGKANLRSQMLAFQESVGDLPLLPATGLDRALATYQPLYDSGRISLILIVSDFVAPGEPGAAPVLPVDSARRLGSGLIPLIVSFRLGEEYQGVGRVWDPERNRQGMIMFSPARRQRINDAERQRVEGVSRSLRDMGLDYAVIRERRQIFPLLAGLARTREHRRL